MGRTFGSSSFQSTIYNLHIFFKGDFLHFFLFKYTIQHCFICRQSDTTVSEDAGIDPGLLRFCRWQLESLICKLDLINFNNTVYILSGISSKIYQQSKIPAGYLKDMYSNLNSYNNDTLTIVKRIAMWLEFQFINRKKKIRELPYKHWPLENVI